MTDMGNRDSRRGAIPLPFLIVILVVMLGIVYWLNQRSNAREAAQAAVAEQMAADSAAAAAAAAEAAAGATVVSGEILQTDPSPYTGQRIRVEALYVTGGLGTQGFWLELPNRNPFLVSLSASARAEGITATFGQTVTVTGTLVAMGDSVLNAWSTAMTIGEGDRLAAEYATHFVEAEMIQVVPDSAGQTGGEG
jgi:hypothetical protein